MHCLDFFVYVYLLQLDVAPGVVASTIYSYDGLLKMCISSESAANYVLSVFENNGKDKWSLAWHTLECFLE